MQPVIQIENLTHAYGSRLALKNLSLQVQPGEILGLLGPNGAGKTTTVRLLNGLLRPRSGRLTVLGFDPQQQGEQVRLRSGVLTETPALYERLTARQNLVFFATLAGMPPVERDERIAELLAYFELTGRANEKVANFSKGMKQRLALARALLHHPRMLFLDEPTSALDPEASAQVRDLIASIGRQDGHTVILCTHILSEAERLCDRIAILGQGRLLAIGTLDELRRQVLPGLWLEVALWGQQPASLHSALQGLAGVQELEPHGDARMRLRVADMAVVPLVAQTVLKQGGQLLRLQPHEVSLEEIYLTLQKGTNGGQS